MANIVLPADLIDYLGDFTREEVGDIFLAILAYANDGVDIKTDDRAVRNVFRQAKSSIDQAREEYSRRCATNKRIAQEREARKATNVHERTRTYTNVHERTRGVTEKEKKEAFPPAPPIEERKEKENNKEKESVIKEKEGRGLASRYQAFANEVGQYAHLYPPDTVSAFVAYWTEPNRTMTKMRYELQPTFAINLRLANWAKRDNNFNHYHHDNINQSTDNGAAQRVRDVYAPVAARFRQQAADDIKRRQIAAEVRKPD